MSKKTSRLITAALLFLFLFLTQFCFDPFAPLVNQYKINVLQTELNVAKAKWSSKRIQDYSYEIVQGAALAGICSAKITVRNGNIVEVVKMEWDNFQGHFRLADILPKSQWKTGWCDYSSFTIPEAFNRLQEYINEKITLSAKFDAELGFISEYYGNQNVGYGFLSSTISDSTFSYTISRFQRLDSSTPNLSTP